MIVGTTHFLKCLSHLLFASVYWVNNWMLTKSSICFFLCAE